MSTIAQVRDALQTMFSRCAESANSKHQIIQRQRKFTAVSIAKTFILGLLQNPDASSEQLAGMAASCDAFVSKQAIEKRYTMRAARFFESLFCEATKLVVQSDESLAPILERFTEVNIGDSSAIQLPDSQQDQFQGRGGSHGFGKSAMKLQTELDLRTGCLKCVEAESSRAPDVSCARQTVNRESGTLRINDLGYFNTATFADLAAQDAWFLSRIQRTTTVWKADKNKGSVIRFLMSQKQTFIDCQVAIGTKHKIPCRLIAWRVPGKVPAERRRKLKLNQKKRGRGTPTKEALAACDWMFLVTNLPAEKLNAKEAIVLYRARWQIELLFKRWKSIGLVSLLKAKNDAATMVRLWARLCAALIQHWITVLCGWRSEHLISFARVAKMIPTIVENLADRLMLPSSIQSKEIERLLIRFQTKTEKSARRDKRKKIGTLELLRNPEKLDYLLS